MTRYVEHQKIKNVEGPNPIEVVIVEIQAQQLLLVEAGLLRYGNTMSPVTKREDHTLLIIAVTGDQHFGTAHYMLCSHAWQYFIRKEG